MNKNNTDYHVPYGTVTLFILLQILIEISANLFKEVPIDVKSLVLHYLVDSSFIFIAITVVMRYQQMRRPGVYLFFIALALICIYLLMKAVYGELIRSIYSGKVNYYVGREGVYYAFCRCIYLLSLITVFVYSRHSLYLRYKAALAEGDRKDAEMKLLEYRYVTARIQNSPHFLNNILAGVSYLVRVDPDKADLALHLTRQFLDYSYHDLDEDKPVPLAEELKQIENCIEMYALRYEDLCHVALTIDLDSSADGVTVPRLLLLSLVENAFKHGVFTVAADPMKITIQCRNCRLKYQSWNLKSQGHVRQSGKMGMRYFTKCLEYRYPGKWKLDIEDMETYYGLELELKLL